MTKRSSNTARWLVWDVARNQYNVANSVLFPDNSDLEQTDAVRNMDIVSNGFKVRTTDTGSNASGDTYIYAAFSEVAFNFARGR